MKRLFTTHFLLMISAIAFFIQEARAHSVQVGYCYNCNGDLRIWVEHWHGAEDPNSTTMTLDVTVNGVTTTYTGVPSGSIMDTPVGNLPGCTNPITIFATCPGQANTYNDWVSYDFNGMPTNVPINITILSGNTVFTADGCSMYPASTGIIIIPPPPTYPDIISCSGNGNTVGPFIFPQGNTWTNSNPSIGIPASGSGDIPAFTPNYSSGVQTATITMNNTCGTSDFVITLNPSPVSNFSAPGVGATPRVCSGQQINFTQLAQVGQGGTIISWTWDFGDGSPTSNAQNPSHTYPTTPNSYNVSLSVTESSGCVHDTTMTLILSAIPVVDFSIDSLCLGNNSNIQNLTTIDNTFGDNISSWAWTFGDGNTSSVQDPIHQYTADGIYTVSLSVVSSGGCTGNATHTTAIYPNPVVNFTPSVVCLQTATQFTDLSFVSSTNTPNSISTWAWDFGDGNTAAIQNPTHTYATSGTFNAQLTVTTNNNCSSMATIPVTVNGMPTAGFTFVNACDNEPILMTSSSSANGGVIANYYWDIDNNGTTDYTTQNISHIYTQDGLHTVTLIVEVTPTCRDTLTQQVTVYTLPNANFTVASVCEDAASQFSNTSAIVPSTNDVISSYFWTLGNGNTSTLQNPTEAYGSENVYLVELEVTTNHGCKDSITLPVTVYPLPVVDFTPTSVCLGDNSQFTNLSTVSNTYTTNTLSQFNWDFGDGTSSTLINPYNGYATDGVFQATLTATSNHGCISQLTKTVTVHPLPVVSFDGINLVGCSPVCPVIHSTSTINQPSTIASYTWQVIGGDSYSGDTLSDCFYNNTGYDDTYSLTLTAVSNEGCISTHTENNYIIVNHNPIAGFYSNPSEPDLINPFVEFTNTSSYANSYQWIVEDMPNATSVNHSVLFPTLARAYEILLVATTVKGCVDTARAVINIKDQLIFYIPNTFTPDGDEYNNIFKPVFASGVDPMTYTLLIFNRWGEILFESHDLEIGWDGSYGLSGNGLVKEGTYIWKITFKETMSDKKHTFEGHVNILK